MKRGFYMIMAAQFFSSLADNALLIAAIAILRELGEPKSTETLLKFYFVVAYVVLAAFVGAFADSMPKRRVMMITNSIKIVGCAMVLFGVHPLLAYCVVGIGAAAYSPAKYGILTELLPPEKLVWANSWIEALTVTSILLGIFVGGTLISPRVSAELLAIDVPGINTGIDTPAEGAIAFIALLYLLAALLNTRIPDTGAVYPAQEKNPIRLLTDFTHCMKQLWSDRLGQISLAVTTLFWAAGGTLQILILHWAEYVLGIGLDQSKNMVAYTAIGIIVGATVASRIPLKKSLNVLPVGVMMGVVVAVFSFYRPEQLLWLAHALSLDTQFLHGTLGQQIVPLAALILIGGLGGFFVVPMNALLQHRGHVLLSAGHSIAVQNFNENLGILVMLLMYFGLQSLGVKVTTAMLLFGIFVACTMLLVIRWHQRNQREFDSIALIGEEKH